MPFGSKPEAYVPDDDNINVHVVREVCMIFSTLNVKSNLTNDTDHSAQVSASCGKSNQ